jgi:RNA polymerase sigma factor (sigma-70 family)
MSQEGESEGICAQCITNPVRHFVTALAFTTTDAEDCLKGFFARMWRDGHCILAGKSPADGPCNRWLLMRRCARNHVIDFARQLAARRRHELFWPMICDGGEGVAWEAPDSGSDPDTALWRNRTVGALDQAMAQITRRQRDLLVRHYYRGESCAEIAVSIGTSEHAVEQALLRARHHLRSLLESQGYTAAELLSDLAPPPLYSATFFPL